MRPALRRLFACVALMFFANAAHAAATETGVRDWKIESPEHTHELVVTLSPEGNVAYALNRRDGGTALPVLASSPLGLATDAGRFLNELKFVSATKPAQVDTPYTMLTGKQLALRDRHTAWSLTLANAAGQPIALDFRVYDEGLAFRYRFPELAKARAHVVGETTGFHFPANGDGKVWMQPFQEVAPWAPSYEDYFTNGTPLGESSPHREGWAFPGLFETKAGWVLVTEADVDGSTYGAHLDALVRDNTYTVRLPLNESAMGLGSVAPTISAPWHGAWRVVIDGRSLATIVESSLVHHVSRPAAPRDWSWVKPGRATWSWWSDHTSPRRVDAIKPFIDLAAKWGWEYSLVDANWNRMEQGTIEEIIDYAKQRGVGILLWYNSGGDHNDITEEPRDRLIDHQTRRAEFARIHALGVKGIKVDFFNSDKPWIMRHYLDILRDAADYELLVDFHGCTLPRGWQRSYPNLMSMEAVRGAEVYGCCEEYAPNAIWQNTILPFTRNVVGSMDYTPVTFTNQKIPHQTTFAHELALSVLFESGVQHFADAVRGYTSLPDYAQSWLKNVPVAWDETRFVDGYPGKLAVLARRKGDSWYLAGAEGAKQARTLSLALPFLKEGGRYRVEVIADGADDKTFSHAERALAADEKLEVSVRAAGGFVAKITPQ